MTVYLRQINGKWHCDNYRTSTVTQNGILAQQVMTIGGLEELSHFIEGDFNHKPLYNCVLRGKLALENEG